MKNGTILSILQRIRERLQQNQEIPKEVVQIKTLIEACDGEVIYSSLDDKWPFIVFFM